MNTFSQMANTINNYDCTCKHSLHIYISDWNDLIEAVQLNCEKDGEQNIYDSKRSNEGHN